MKILGKEIVLDKKFVITKIPFIFVWYFSNKIIGLYRLTDGNATVKMQTVVFHFNEAFNSLLPCFEIGSIIGGFIVVAVLKLYLYDKKQNAKKFRSGVEYGSAKWGTKKTIEPYMDSNPRKNLIFSWTEGLVLGRAKAPQYERNKNVLVIGGSGSGKTRFYAKPNIMQMHCSYVITDPKGTTSVR